MEERYFIGVDLGTTLAKCAIYGEDGRAVAEATHEMKIEFPRAGVAEQDASSFYTVTCSLIRRCVAQANATKALSSPGTTGADVAASPRASRGGVAGHVAAIGIDSQMGGIMAVDKRFDPVIPYDTPLDTRSAEENRSMHGKHGDLILEKSGSFSTYGNKILYWKKRNEWNDIHAFVHPSAFVAGRLGGLSGNDAYMDETFICFSGLCDLRKSAWSEEVCGALGLGMEKLPRIVKPTEIVGELTAQASRDTGLPRGVVVIAGCGDQAAGFTGAGILSPGRMVDVSGTACIFGANTSRFTCDTRHKTVVCMRSAWGNTYYLMSVVLGGMTHKWLVETFFPDEKDAKDAGSDRAPSGGTTAGDAPGDVYSRLDREAAKLPPGSDGLVSINYLQGRFFPPDPDVRGLFIGHSLAHGRAHFYRAVLESIAYDHAIAKEIIRELLPDLVMGRVTAIGSGARSRLWMRIKADVLQLPYDNLHRSDLSTLGSALLAGNAVGAYPDVEATAKRFAKRCESVEPVPGEDRKYRRYVEIYGDLFSSLEGIYAKLAT